MNYVGTATNQSQKYTFRELKESKETAFIGDLGSCHNELFLITYSAIVLAVDPTQTWIIDDSSDTKHVSVDYFVDVNITVANKK
jgi:hypothetical protein